MKKMKNIMEWTRKEFEALPKRKSFNTPIECDTLVILPTRRIHESGWRMMDFVAVSNGKPICRCSGCSDVLDIDGIGGYGINQNITTGIVKAAAWKIDCLPKSGLLRIDCNYKIKVGYALSDFEIFATNKLHSEDTKEIPF